MPERTFFTFDPIGGPADNIYTVALDSIAAFRRNTNTNRVWIILVTGEEYEITQALWDLMKSKVDTNP
jgi:hypothetical protein